MKDFFKPKRRKVVQMADIERLPVESDAYAERREQLAPLIAALYKKLSPKEREVLALMQQKLAEERVATVLGVSRREVRTYRGRIQQKVKKLVANLTRNGGDSVGVLVVDDALRF